MSARAVGLGGYWWPPGLEEFDPCVRPLSWWWATIDGKNVRYPGPVDAEIFGIDPDPALIDAPVYPEVDVRYPSGALIYGGHAWNKPGTTPWFTRPGVTQRDRLRVYQELINIHAPEDPGGGGLAPDTVDVTTGTIVRQYWDFSGTSPVRKRISFIPKGTGMTYKIEQFDSDNQRWGGEGWDLERDVVNALPDIIKAFNAITTAFVGFVSGMPALAAAWAKVANISSSAALGGPPPSLMDFASAAAQYLGSAPGFGNAMADMTGSQKLVQSIMGSVGTLASTEISQLGALVTPYLLKLQQTGITFAKQIPKIDLSAAAKNVIPPDVQKAADNAQQNIVKFDLDSYRKATFAYLQGFSLNDVAAIRKGALDTATFDVTYAACVATVQAAPGALVDSGDFGGHIGKGAPAQNGGVVTPAAPAAAHAGGALVAIGAAAGLGTAALAIAPLAKIAMLPMLSKKEIYIGAGVSAATILAGLLMRKAAQPAEKPVAQSAETAGGGGNVSLHQAMNR